VQNREAARYARWAAVAAGLVALTVAGVYARRAYRESQARRHAPKAVPVTVQQQSAEFKFSKVEQDTTIFTIRASQATQFKGEDRSVLQDVWITIYGREGNRNDNIHTRECSYGPSTGDIRCEGEVQIEIHGTSKEPDKPGARTLEVKTHDLTFNRESGEASTSEPVEFNFAEGHGRGVGVVYSTRDSQIRLQRAVEVDFSPGSGRQGVPIHATGSSFEVRRDRRVMVLHGPTWVKQADRELTAEQISIELDPEFHAHHVVADGHPTVHAVQAGGQFAMTGDRIEGFLTPAGGVERVLISGNVEGTRESAAGKDHASAARAEFTVQPERNLITALSATGGVTLDSNQGSDSRSLKTDSLLVKFGQARRADQQRVESAETMAPGIIETKGRDDSTTLKATKFVAHLDAAGRMDRLDGHSGVEVRRQIGTAAAQSITSSELAATFDAKGQWKTLDETGKVHFQQADRQATAAHARVDHRTDTITLDGSPVLSDAVSRTAVQKQVIIHQKSGDIAGTGGVVSTYLASARGASTVNMGSGPAHISADLLTGSTVSGHAVYSGHARLWQDQSLLNGDQIKVWRDEKKLEATGHVVAMFPQSAGQPGLLGRNPAAAGGKKPAPISATTTAGPVLWEVRAPILTYWSELGKAHLEGGVAASSAQGELVSRNLDVFLAPAGAKGGVQPGGDGSGLTPAMSRQLDHAIATGDVVVRQGDRRGTAEQAVYTSTDGKFVLSGGKPTIIDASGDTTTGHSLTFFVASDTILIDSQEGSRTLTKHRVEK
jgi:LPS export ABC transporter protein LptC